MDKNQFEQAIFELYENTLQHIENYHSKIDLFEIPNELAKEIETQTGIKVEKHWISIDNFGIIHTLEKHGNPIAEAKRGQVAIQKEDFSKWIDVILNFDKITFVGVSRHTNQPLLQFEKKIDNYWFVIKEVRTITSIKKKKINRLMFHTMYKIKATENNSTALKKPMSCEARSTPTRNVQNA